MVSNHKNYIIRNVCWKKILPTCVKSGSFVVQKSAMCSEIITLSNAIGGEGFNNMQTAEIEELMRESPLDEDDLIEFMIDYDNEEVEDEVQLLTAEFIREGLKFATSMEQHFLTQDPDMERALQFQRNLKLCVAG